MYDDQTSPTQPPTPGPTPAAGPGTPRGSRKRAIAVAAAVGTAGVLAGGVLASTLTASADASTGAATQGYGRTGAPGGELGNGNTDPSKPMRSDETLLTGTTKDKVLAAVKAKYPDATVQRAETDSGGVYEAHIVNGGSELIVQVGKDFTITGTQTGGGPGGHGPGGHGDGDGDGPGAAPSAGAEG